MQNNLEIVQLKKKYKDFELEIFEMKVKKGEIVGLIGENGAGKTTTINLILNEVEKDSGKIQIAGYDNILHEREAKEKMGIVFDECFFPELLCIDEIGHCMKHIYKNWDEKTFSRYLESFQLPTRKAVKEFSKGMKMKLGLIVALSHNPEILILDEATSALDPVARDEILGILKGFVATGEKSVIFSTHITSDIQQIADNIVFLHKGQVVFSEKKDCLLEKYKYMHCQRKDMLKIDRKDIKAKIESAGEIRLLLNNCMEINEKYKEYSLRNATIEEIMLFSIKGEEKCMD